MINLQKLVCTGSLILFLIPLAMAQTKKAVPATKASNQAKTVNGIVQGNIEKSGIRSFKGVPFAAPPVGNLRWKEPQPAKNWTGVKKSEQFGPRAMQRAIFGDMNFRSNGVSEDCLYLNVWTPAKTDKEKLPVLVYFYGGGFMAGDGSEPRYDGESMAQRGIVSVTVNYRLGVFGFMAHPELSKENPKGASGNYGLLDQYAALKWVQQNIAAFGGDPKKVTIAGESAGSYSVSAQMASPLSKNLFAGAIGESGSLLSLQPSYTLAQAEQDGVKFAATLGATSLADLRALPAEQILEATAKQGTPRFSAIVDGYFFPKSPSAIFAAGEQAKVPLLAGWNSEENGARSILGQEAPTPMNFEKAVQKIYGDKAPEILKVYSGKTEDEILQAATDLAGDRFIGYSTWKWIDVHSKTSGKPTYRYMYSRPRPEMTPEMGNATPGLAGGIIRNTEPTAPKPPAPKGAVHSAEIEYALGNLGSNKVYSWKPEDYTVSKTMQAYFANFIKTGNPNGNGLPTWPSLTSGKPAQVMYIDVNTALKTEKNEARFSALEKAAAK